MAEAAILRGGRAGETDAEMWLARAAQARRLALALSLPDVQLLEAYASECEQEATRLLQVPPIAA